MTTPKTRADAVRVGAKYYLTGKACVWGHMAMRSLDRRCTQCAKERHANTVNKRASMKEVGAMRRMFLHRATRTSYNRMFVGFPNPLRPPPTSNACECCGRVDTKRQVALDHDHKTHEFRGWLCMHCNTGIGKLGDSEQGVLLALEYLRRKGKAVESQSSNSLSGVAMSSMVSRKATRASPTTIHRRLNGVAQQARDAGVVTGLLAQDPHTI